MKKKEHLPNLALLIKMLSNALELKKGLYITFLFSTRLYRYKESVLAAKSWQ
ncbi:hypothetical protein [Nostoc sp. ChiQUE01b]|uniref:hypothetical protein n=1 Tax=Nostoc sp. ChiQUE01b TaxID=3075376 RepID=UPI002AD2BFAF|nr:hypothetical protein [Nostoc sp. ChiQUE01b]MDZ8260150.1 hypothetical protein [Nostoc sp. ChiQUE01b]